MLRSMLLDTFNSGGYTDVTEAEDGIVALDKVRSKKFDFIITDINMPNMDGLTFIKELRKLDNYVEVPLLVLTTERGDDMKSKGKLAGANGWIIKPFIAEQLLQAVNIVMNKNKK